eukprot:1159388-Pelagomonas_calceolata.AAC.6
MERNQPLQHLGGCTAAFGGVALHLLTQIRDWALILKKISLQHLDAGKGCKHRCLGGSWAFVDVTQMQEKGMQEKGVSTDVGKGHKHSCRGQMETQMQEKGKNKRLTQQFKLGCVCPKDGEG